MPLISDIEDATYIRRARSMSLISDIVDVAHFRRQPRPHDAKTSSSCLLHDVEVLMAEFYLADANSEMRSLSQPRYSPAVHASPRALPRSSLVAHPKAVRITKRSDLRSGFKRNFL